MSIFDVALVGIALAIDACAVTISNCATYKCSMTKKQEWYMPIAFALFQGLMPLIGYLIGSAFSSIIGSFTGYLTSAIFFILALKIIIDILKGNSDAEKECSLEEKPKPFTLWLVIVQAVATSIDALAVGVGFIDLACDLWLAIAVIVGITFVLVVLALFFGKTIGRFFGKYAEWFGAGILLVLAIKSLLEAILG